MERPRECWLIEEEELARSLSGPRGRRGGLASLLGSGRSWVHLSLGQGESGRGPGMNHSRAWTDDQGWQGWTINNRYPHDPSSSPMPRVPRVPGDGSGICHSILTTQVQPSFGLLHEDTEADVVQSLSRVRLCDPRDSGFPCPSPSPGARSNSCPSSR